MKRTVETELVSCDNMEGGVLFGIKQTRGNPERHYAGLLTLKGPDGYLVTLPDGRHKRCPSWYDVENVVVEWVKGY